MNSVCLVECPRDAMQGIPQFIPTDEKVAYLQSLLAVGFDILDFGSFVSPKAVPQMQDTETVIKRLDLSNTSTQLLAIVVNRKGIERALAFEAISYLGYPFSVSPTFQYRNARKTLEESYHELGNSAERVKQAGKELVVYISMGFGNPYGDVWSIELVLTWIERLARLGIRIFSLADTVGTADMMTVRKLFEEVISTFPQLQVGVHLHASPQDWQDKIAAAFEAGCRYFDAAMQGYGGCPFAEDELVGNVATEKLVAYLQGRHVSLQLDMAAFRRASEYARQLFTKYAS